MIVSYDSVMLDSCLFGCSVYIIAAEPYAMTDVLRDGASLLRE